MEEQNSAKYMWKSGNVKLILLYISSPLYIWLNYGQLCSISQAFGSILFNGQILIMGVRKSLRKIARAKSQQREDVSVNQCHH